MSGWNKQNYCFTLVKKQLNQVSKFSPLDIPHLEVFSFTLNAMNL